MPVRFQRANLQGANFTGARIESADFTDSQYRDALLGNAKMIGCVGLELDDL